MNAEDVKKELEKHASKEKAAASQRFFKTGKGQYGEGDKFIGVTVPEQRTVSKAFKELPLTEIKKLLSSPVHEHRLTALIILVNQYPNNKDGTYSFYLENRKHINNWDLVDCSAPNIVGTHLLNNDKSTLYKLASSENLWERRIAIVSTLTFIRNKQFDDTIEISKLYLDDEHDLIHKATGWMLREMGKQDEKELLKFLDKHHKEMPRTMLRYSIERLSQEHKKKFMS